MREVVGSTGRLKNMSLALAQAIARFKL